MSSDTITITWQITLNSIDIDKTVAEVKRYLTEEKEMSPGFVDSMNLLLVLVSFLADKLGLNSRNSSKPPSSDPYRRRFKKQLAREKLVDKKAIIGKRYESLPIPTTSKKYRWTGRNFLMGNTRLPDTSPDRLSILTFPELWPNSGRRFWRMKIKTFSNQIEHSQYLIKR